MHRIVPSTQRPHMSTTSAPRNMHSHAHTTAHMNMKQRYTGDGDGRGCGRVAR
jgi:hypothetical protein